jgi:ribose transport system substrate-binding protein
MKRLFSSFFICTMLLLAGCSASDGTGAPLEQSGDMPLRITAILPHDDALLGRNDGYWNFVMEGAATAAEEINADVKLVVPQVNYDVDQITDLIYQEVYAQADAIIVQGIDDADYIAALHAANDAEIQVVLVDTDVDTGFDCLYIGTDNLEAGRNLGQCLLQATGGHANVLVISGSKGYPNVEERLQGFMDAIGDVPGIQIMDIAYDNFDSLTVMEEFNRMIASFPSADTVVCLEGTGGQALCQNLSRETTPVENLFVFDRTDSTEKGLENGLVSVILAQDPQQMGYLAVQEIYRYITMGSYSSDVLHTPTEILTKAGENVDAA